VRQLNSLRSASCLFRHTVEPAHPDSVFFF
jgi:hypothetical protein